LITAIQGTSTANTLTSLEASIAAVSALVGTTTDAALTASVFGKIADVSALLGTTSDAALTASVFGKIAAVKGVADTLGADVGLAKDSAIDAKTEAVAIKGLIGVKYTAASGV